MTLDRLSAYEIATGFPLGDVVAIPGRRGSVAVRRGAREDVGAALVALEDVGAALEDVVLEALLRPPCVVHFSGGRDSSAILAIAVRAARRHGLDAPVALTVRFPGVPESREDEWQDLVVGHLGIADWIRVDAGAGADLLGPPAQQVLRRHGVIWSPLLATRLSHMAPATGGSLLSGEGGDELLGPRRPTSIGLLLGARAPRRAAALATPALADLAPRRLRTRHLRSTLAGQLALDWLWPEVWEDFLERCADQFASEPLAWGRAIEWIASSRHVRLGIENMTALAAEIDVNLVVPFTDRRVVRALGGAFGRLGPRGRTDAMRALFGPLLPDALIARSTKATFNGAAFGEPARAFVAQWDGSGVPRDLVDVDALRRHWSGPRPSGLSFALLQSAWLASQRSPLASIETVPNRTSDSCTVARSIEANRASPAPRL